MRWGSHAEGPCREEHDTTCSFRLCDFPGKYQVKQLPPKSEESKHTGVSLLFFRDPCSLIRGVESTTPVKQSLRITMTHVGAHSLTLRDEHVVRLDIPVHDAFAVNKLQG